MSSVNCGKCGQSTYKCKVCSEVLCNLCADDVSNFKEEKCYHRDCYASLDAGEKEKIREAKDHVIINTYQKTIDYMAALIKTSTGCKNEFINVYNYYVNALKHANARESIRKAKSELPRETKK